MHDKRLPKDLFVRRLHGSDQEEIFNHFLRLDVQTRRARFCGAINDNGVLKYAQNILQHDSIACGAFVGGQLRGLVELSGPFHSGSSNTEAAFSVETAWQNIGIGDALFERMFAMAQNRGIRTIHMLCLKENGKMRHLAEKHSARLVFDADVVAAVLHPSWPTPASIAKEFIAETREISHQFLGAGFMDRLRHKSLWSG